MFWRPWLNRLRRRLVRALMHRMVFGESSPGHTWPHTRISPSTCIEHEEGLTLADHVYIGPFNVLEASSGITLEEGVQVTSHCSLITHSSHRSIRLLGRAYANPQRMPDSADQQGAAPFGAAPRPGWIEGAVRIGAYSFIGPHSVIEAGTQIGRGSVVCAGSVVRGVHPDFAVLRGNPAVVVGDTRQVDEALLAQHPELRPLREAWAQASDR